MLGGIDFYNVNQGVFRFDGAAFQSLGTFQRNARYTLVATIDFAANRWSVTLNGGTVFTNQPLTATTNALTLGDIDAAWFITTAGSPGNNYMVFDNYRISTASSDVARAFTAQPPNRDRRRRTKTQSSTFIHRISEPRPSSGKDRRRARWFCQFDRHRPLRERDDVGHAGARGNRRDGTAISSVASRATPPAP